GDRQYPTWIVWPSVFSLQTFRLQRRLKRYTIYRPQSVPVVSFLVSISVFVAISCIEGQKSGSSAASTAEIGTLQAPLLALCIGRRLGMLYTLAVILLIAWLLGLVGTYTIGAFLHVLLVIAIVLFLVGLLSGRRTVV